MSVETYAPSGRTPYQELVAAVAEDPDAELVSFLDGGAHTRAEVLGLAEQVTAGLLSRGIEAGDRVVLMIGNRIEFLAVWMGILGAGAVAVPLNTAMRGRVLEHMLELSEPALLIAEEAQREAVGAAVAGLDRPGEPVWLGDGPTVDGSLAALLAEPAGPAPGVHGRPEDFSHILFTSGTTGPSKGVMWSNQTAVSMAEGGIAVMGYRADDVVYTCLPLFHSNALFTTLLAALMRRARVVVSPRFTASGYWEQVAESRATTVSLLGSMVPILRKRPPSEHDRGHRVRRALVIPLGGEDQPEFERRFGVESTSLYGLTDVGTPIGIPDGLGRPDSCGVVLPGWECMLADEHDDPVSVGEVGELLVRPKRPFMGQLGYWRMPQETIAAWRNLWYHTGDLMRQDDDGWFYFLDRSKDAIRRFGENISSYEVEQALLEHPAVDEAAAYSVGSELSEDEVMVAVVLGGRETASAAELADWCESRLPYFAVPRFIRITDQLPRTTTLKVRKDLLRRGGVDGAYDHGPTGLKARRARKETSA